jgi:DNA processing protein
VVFSTTSLQWGGQSRMTDDRNYWLALSMVKGVGAMRFRALLNAFGNPQAAWNATPMRWRDAGMSESIVANFSEARQSIQPPELPAKLAQHNVNAFILDDPEYPRKLRELDQAPPVLYVKGELLPEDEWAVAIVGTRNLTSYGQRVANELGEFLAHNSITIVSGLARGVDSVAHQAALRAGGRTLAVLAHGLDQVYPAENRKLAAEIIERGALISDYGIGVPPDNANFPPRNRIISGLSLAVVIVEAGLQSGALITAGFAAEQGREVFAVPGNIFVAQSKGSNLLIQRGAHPLVRFEDILDLLNLEMMTEHKTATTALPSDPTEAKLFALLTQEPLHLNELCALADLPIDKVSSALALMELKGLARQVSGMNYIAARELKAEYKTQ